MFKKKQQDEELIIDLGEDDTEVKKKRFPTLKFLAKMIPVLVIIGGVSYGTMYHITNSKLDTEIDKTMKEIEEVNAENEEKAKANISSSTIPQEVLDKAITISVSSDDVPQELIEPDKSNPIRNDKGWFLVDTDGDNIGDAYWNITKEDAESGKYGKMYVFSYTKRKYIKHILQKADPKRGIKEKFEWIPDPSQVIPPNVLIPAQFYKKDTGTVLDFSKVE